MKPGFEQDPHSEAGNACPQNKFGITDYSDLQAIETVYTIKRREELAALGVSGKFDSAHLRAVHRYLFQDVFPWAGEVRVVNLSKGTANFGPARFIEAALAETLAKLKVERYLAGLTCDEFAQRAAFYLGEINAIHPFREGNGRTQREFIRQLATQAGHPLSWAGFTQEEMVAASIRSHLQGDNGGLAAILERALFSIRGWGA